MSEAASLQLEVLPLEIDGQVYPLRCNMNVLEKLQNGPGKGEIGNLFQIPTFSVVFEITAAMIEDACEDDPALPAVPMRRLKKLFSPAQLARLGIFRMFARAISPEQEETGQVSDPDTNQPPENSGN